MKKVFCLFLLITVLFIGCDSGGSDNDGNDVDLIPVKITIDGVEKTYYTDGYSWESPGYDVFLAEDFSYDESINEIYFIIRNDNNNMVKDFTSVSDDLKSFIYTDNYGLDYDADVADAADTITVTVTEWNDDESATLSFSGIVDGISISSEVFTVPYIEERKISR